MMRTGYLVKNHSDNRDWGRASPRAFFGMMRCTVVTDGNHRVCDSSRRDRRSL